MVFDVKSLPSSGAEKFRWCKHKAIQIESTPSARSALVLVCLFEVGAQGPAQGPRGLGPFLLNDSARRGFVVQLKLCCRLPFHVSWIGYYAYKTFLKHFSNKAQQNMHIAQKAQKSAISGSPWLWQGSDKPWGSQILRFLSFLCYMHVFFALFLSFFEIS